MQLYGCLDARACSDLDFLVKPDDVAPAVECLRKQGFLPHEEAKPGMGTHPVKSHHQVWCKKATNGPVVVVELHQRLGGLRGCQPSAESLSAASRTLCLLGQPLRVPSLQDELVLLCCHAHQHNFGFLRCLIDVAEYVKRNDSVLDWENVYAAARVSRACGRVSSALWLAHAMFGLTKRAVGCILPPMGRQLWAVRGLTGDRLGALGEEANRKRTLRLALLMDRWRDVFKHLCTGLFPPAEYLRAIYPSAWAGVPGLARACYVFRGLTKVIESGN
jgi:hypothetical protein